MNFIAEITLSDIFTGLSTLFVVFGGIFAYYKWRRDFSLKKISFINELIEKISTDPIITNTLYLLDYDESWYSPAFHSGSSMESQMDETLSYFSYICYMIDQNIISDKELKFFKYDIERILDNQDLQDYFYNLYHFSKKSNVPFAFQYLFEYGNKHNFFDVDFFNPNAHETNSKYHNYLNF